MFSKLIELPSYVKVYNYRQNVYYDMMSEGDVGDVVRIMQKEEENGKEEMPFPVKRKEYDDKIFTQNDLETRELKQNVDGIEDIENENNYKEEEDSLNKVEEDQDIVEDDNNDKEDEDQDKVQDDNNDKEDEDLDKVECYNNDKKDEDQDKLEDEEDENHDRNEEYDCFEKEVDEEKEVNEESNNHETESDEEGREEDPGKKNEPGMEESLDQEGVNQEKEDSDGEKEMKDDDIWRDDNSNPENQEVEVLTADRIFLIMKKEYRSTNEMLENYVL